MNIIVIVLPSIGVIIGIVAIVWWLRKRGK